MMKKYEMSQADFDSMLEKINVARRAPQMLIGGTLPASPQEVANDAWRELGSRMGFKWETAKPDPDNSNQRFFIAEPLQ